jgi:glycosyltransferase involved in cell wall biosynthesis
MKKILLITYHFPPSAASGTFRLLGFARHLPAFGWQPLVVAPPCLPWEPIDTELLAQVPREVIVHHAHYPIGTPRALRKFAQNAVWLPRAWFACRRIIKEHRPDVILTSGPPHCVHALGHHLKRSTGLPWVADFRDPWISDGGDKQIGWFRRFELRWERRVFQNADLVLANAPNAQKRFMQAHPLQCDKIITLTNGFDPRPHVESEFRAHDGLRLLHAGEIYGGRDPLPLFEALADLNKDAPAYQLDVLGRNEIDLDGVLRERGWTDFVHVLGQRAYQDSLDEMGKADILVLFDSPGRTVGVPAKLYEYLGAGRPILALAESNGDTAAVLRASGVVHRLASPKNASQIRQALDELSQPLDMVSDEANSALLSGFTRKHLTATLSSRLDALLGTPNIASLRIHGGSAEIEKRPAPQPQEAKL